MSEPKQIPVAQKSSTPLAKANSLPLDKTSVPRTQSSPSFAGDTSAFGAALRRRSDSLFHSNEQLPKDETDSKRRSNVSTLSSEDDERSRSGSTTSPEQPGIDAWLEWRNKRRNSTPAVCYGSSVGTSV